MSPVEEKNGVEVTGEKTTTLDDAKARIPKNVAWNWASFGFTIGVSLLIAPLLVHKLGEVEFGIWALVRDVVGYSWFFGFGVGPAIVRYIARYYAADDREGLNKVGSTATAFTVLAAILALVGCSFLAYALPDLFAIPPGLVSTARWTVILVGVSIAGGLAVGAFPACLAAASRYDLLGLHAILSSGIRALLLWYFLEHGHGLLAVALISTGATLFGYGLYWRFARRQFPALKIRPRYFDRSMLGSLMNFSVYSFMIAVASRIIYMTDTIVVGFVLGPAAVAFYAVGAKLPAMLRGSMGNITKLYFPFASQMDALGKRDGLRRLYLAGTRIASLYVFAGAAGLAMLGPSFLDLWMGRPFGERSGPVIILLAAEVAFFALASGSSQVLYGMNRHKFNAWLSLSNATANLTLSVILVRTMGAVGVAWGTAIPAAVAEGIILPVYTAHLLGVRVRRFYYEALLQPLAATVPFAAWLWFCRVHGFASGYIDLVVITVLGLVLFAAVAWTFSVNAPERDAALRWLGRTRLKVLGKIA